MSDTENDPLLNSPNRRQQQSLKKNPLVWFLSAWAVVASIFCVYTSFTPPNNNNHYKPPNPNRKRNLIMMVSDGMGPASLSLTRSFRQHVEELPIDDILTLDKHIIGHSRTRSSDSLITDSAAGATAFSCSAKSYNGAISVLPNKQACGTVLEAAKLAGYYTGLVVTTRITDATPACFSSHASTRGEEDLIATHQIGDYPLGRMVDLILGGGRCHYLPKSKGGCRKDNRNLITEAENNGWNYVGSMDGYKQLDNGNNVTLPLLGLLANTDIPFDLDRKNAEHPSLEDTTRTALKALSDATADSDKGFFIMIEGSRVDHAGHANDPAAQVREVLAYDSAFNAAIEFAENSDVETIVVSTSDHETGGLAVGRQLTSAYPEYLWHPQVLANASHSGEYLAKQLKNYNDNGDQPKLKEYIKEEIFEKGLGILNYDENELDDVVNNKNSASNSLVEMVSKRSQTGWSTHGHTAVDVNLYGYAAHRFAKQYLMEKLGGSHENTEVGKFLADYLNVDLDHVTSKLKNVKTLLF